MLPLPKLRNDTLYRPKRGHVEWQPVLRKNAAAIIQVVWRDHSHGANGPIESSSAKVIRYYLSLIPEAFKFVWAHVNVAENTPQSANFERSGAMHWHGRTRGLSSHDRMAPAYPHSRKALRLQEAHHLLAAWARESSHGVR